MTLSPQTCVYDDWTKKARCQGSPPPSSGTDFIDADKVSEVVTRDESPAPGTTSEQCYSESRKCADDHTLLWCIMGYWTVRPCKYGRCIQGSNGARCVSLSEIETDNISKALPRDEAPAPGSTLPDRCPGNASKCYDDHTILVCIFGLWEPRTCKSGKCFEGNNGAHCSKIPQVEDNNNKIEDIATRDEPKTLEMAGDKCEHYNQRICIGDGTAFTYCNRGTWQVISCLPDKQCFGDGTTAYCA